jgi:hypothetical protein
VSGLAISVSPRGILAKPDRRPVAQSLGGLGGALHWQDESPQEIGGRVFPRLNVVLSSSEVTDRRPAWGS